MQGPAVRRAAVHRVYVGINESERECTGILLSRRCSSSDAFRAAFGHAPSSRCYGYCLLTSEGAAAAFQVTTQFCLKYSKIPRVVCANSKARVGDA